MSENKNASEKPTVDENGTLRYPTFVKRGDLLQNRDCLSPDDEDHTYNYLRRHEIIPEDFGIEHPRTEEYKNYSRDDLINEIEKLKKEILACKFEML